MKRNHKFGIGACLMVGAIGYLMYAGVEQSSMYYVTVEEFLARKDALADQGLRVAGRVTTGSLSKQTTAKGTELKFSLGDFANGAGEIVPVEFTGVVPDMFGEGRDVIIEGRYIDGVLRAQTVLTSCPSKYEADGDDTDPAAGKQASSY